MTPIAPHIAAWFHQRLPIERAASPHTCHTYAITFQLLFQFAAARLKVAPAALVFENIDSDLVSAFLEHLQRDRGNGGRTRNARLAAIKSFMRFMQYRHAAGLDQIRHVLSIPSQRVDARPVGHLARDEVRALVNVPDPTKRAGIRDRALLLVGVMGGLRVSELAGLRMEQISFRDRYLDLRVMGKGRRERVLTLWKEVADAVRAWLSVRGHVRVPEVFVNARGEALTRSGIEYILKRHVAKAIEVCPPMQHKRITPHTLRHSCAISTMQATRDIRKVALWLGHSSTHTTETVYLRADPTDKLETLEAVVPPSLRKGQFSPPDKLLALLRRPMTMRSSTALQEPAEVDSPGPCSA